MHRDCECWTQEGAKKLCMVNLAPSLTAGLRLGLGLAQGPWFEEAFHNMLADLPCKYGTRHDMSAEIAIGRGRNACNHFKESQDFPEYSSVNAVPEGVVG